MAKMSLAIKKATLGSSESNSFEGSGFPMKYDTSNVSCRRK